MKKTYLEKAKWYKFPFFSQYEKNQFYWNKLLFYIRSIFATKKSIKIESHRFNNINLSTKKFNTNNTDDRIILICNYNNPANQIKQFLYHYRKLGVEKFVFVDDGSDDETDRIISTAQDVDIYTSNVPYGNGNDRIWRQMLIERYGLDRWYLSVDIDEYLVFHDSENRTMVDLAMELSRRGEKHMVAMMLDIYPDGPLDSAAPLEEDSTPVWSACPCFDSDGYFVRPQIRGTSIRGGPRYRMFGFEGRINKIPFFYADRRTRFDGSAHSLYPYSRNFVPIRGILLHNKFGHGFRNWIQRTAELKRHGGTEFYTELKDSGSYNSDTDLRYEGTLKYNSTRELIELGFIDQVF